MIGTTSSGTLIVLFGTYILYVHTLGQYNPFRAGLLEMGLPVEEGRPLPGVQRLDGEPTTEFGLQVNFEATWSDTAKAARIASMMQGATVERPGVRQLHYVDFGNSEINVYMTYRSAKEFAEWAYSPVARYAAEILPDLLTSVRTEVYGDVDDDSAREEQDNWQAVYFDRLDGFVDLGRRQQPSSRSATPA